MILVTLGTQNRDFSRLLDEIEKQIKNKNIKEKVIVQAGYTKYNSDNMEIFDFISSDELEKLVKKCTILITHGGVGSILTGIKNNKPIIAAARLSKYREHTNDHQKQIIKEFEDEGYLLELRDFKKLDKLLVKANSFKPKKFTSNTNNFTSNIKEYIEADNHISWFNRYRHLSSNGYRGVILSLINVLIFCILFGKLNLYLNILVSFFITFIITLITNKFIDVKLENKSIIVNILSLIIDLDLMYILTNMINYNIVYSKFIVDLVIIIISIIVVKFIFRKKI